MLSEARRNSSQLTSSTTPAVSWAYDAVGNRITAAGQPLTVSAFGNPFLFTGREWDAEIGLYYYRARCYKPSLGRFISRDPVFADRYRYVGNNPLNAVDPWGLFPPLVAPMSLPPLDIGRGGRRDGPDAPSTSVRWASWA